jgi:hypothetical protein
VNAAQPRDVLLLLTLIHLSVGDYNTKPTIVADANFVGIAVIGALNTFTLPTS